MGNRIGAVMTVVVLSLSSCTADEPPDAAPPSPGDTESVAPLISSLPDECGSLGRAPRRGQVTFIRGGKLYASSSDGEGVLCLGRAPEGGHPAWGGLGDRLFLTLSGSRGRMLFPDKDVTLEPGLMRPISFGLSRPRGLSVLFASADRRRLYKMPATGGRLEDISFLKRHDEAVYHPAGEHIAVVGERRDGKYGIFLATNLGTDPQLLVVGEDAKRIYSLSFAPNGFLYYAAEHEDRYDVHGVSLLPTPAGKVDTDRLETYYSSPDVITKVVSSPFHDEGELAIEVGTDGDGCPSRTVLYTPRNKEQDLPFDTLTSTEPIAWMPNRDLVFTTLDDETCDTTGDVYVYDGTADLLIEDARTVAVRGIYRAAPDPPNVLPEVVA
ncbi:MAG: TolB family protein [Actinomycetota bacterium]